MEPVVNFGVESSVKDIRMEAGLGLKYYNEVKPYSIFTSAETGVKIEYDSSYRYGLDAKTYGSLGIGYNKEGSGFFANANATGYLGLENVAVEARTEAGYRDYYGNSASAYFENKLFANSALSFKDRERFGINAEIQMPTYNESSLNISAGGEKLSNERKYKPSFGVSYKAKLEN